MADAANSRIEDVLAQEGFVRELARRLLQDLQQAEDVTQHSLWMGVRWRPRRDKLRAFLTRITRNRVIDVQRASRSRDRIEREVAQHQAVPSAAEMAERAELRQVIAEAVLTLPQQYRDVIWLRFYEDLPPREIAKRLEAPVTTIKTRIGRAVSQLRERLQRRDGDVASLALGLWSLTGWSSRTPWLPIAVTGTVLAVGAFVLSRIDRDSPALDLASLSPERRFDWLVGEWTMEPQQYRNGRWAPTDRGRSVVTRIDDNTLIDRWIHPNGDGVMLRAFDPAAERWRIFWTNSTNLLGAMQVWEGNYRDGEFTFTGGDIEPNLPAPRLSRIVFSDITADSCSWEMHASEDRGKTWSPTGRRRYTRIR